VAEETYDPARVEQLVRMLRELARRIQALDERGSLLAESSTLLAALGDLRAELFRYEVRKTFDTPEQAEHRRIAREAARGWSPELDAPEDEEWRQADGH
jgi:hypothetical protein